MITIYLISTLACFLGWIRHIPYINKNKWLSRIFYVLAWLGLVWASIQLNHLFDSLSDDESFEVLKYYFAYLLFSSFIFYFIVQYFIKKSKK